MRPAASASAAADLCRTSLLRVKDTQVDVTRLIYMLYQDVEQQIHRADFKAQLTLSTAAVLTAMMVNIGPGLRLDSWVGMQLFEQAVLALYSLFILCMCLAFGCGIAAAFPRTVKKAADANSHPSLYFSGQIAQMSGADYADFFCQQSNDGGKRSVLGQVHSKCIVLEAKIHLVRLGLSFLVLALVWWMAARFVWLIGNGLR
jgi:hypothetical protein